MTRNRFARFALLAMFALAPGLALAAPEIGKPAPDFTATDVTGKSHTLSAYKGKPVVLEWTNHMCPFVKKHYGSGNMQSVQKFAAGKGAVWLAVNSSAKDKEGHIDAEQGKKVLAEQKSNATALILDPEGKIGRMYEAKTTPHIYIIAADGTLAYMGAIDDKPGINDDAGKAHNYARSALTSLLEGKPVEPASTQPYGCSVKY